MGPAPYLNDRIRHSQYGYMRAQPSNSPTPKVLSPASNIPIALKPPPLFVRSPDARPPYTSDIVIVTHTLIDSLVQTFPSGRTKIRTYE